MGADSFENEMQLAGDNASMQLVAHQKLQDEKIAAEQDYLVKTNRLYNISLQTVNALKNAISNAFSVRDDSESKRHEEAMKNIAKEAEALEKNSETEQQNLLDKLKKKEISMADYINKEAELQESLLEKKSAIAEKEKAEKEKSADSQFNISKQFANATAEALKVTYESTRVSYQNTLSKHQKADDRYQKAKQKKEALSAKLGKEENAETRAEYNEALEEMASTEDELNKTRQQSWIDMGITAGAQMAQLLAAGESFGKAIGKVAFDGLNAQIPVIIAGIMGNAISTLGPIAGPIATGVLTAGFMGLVSIAKNALRFETGGLNPYGFGDLNDMTSPGMKMITINESFGRPEFIFKHENTMKNLSDFSKINSQDITIEEHIKRNRPDIQQRIIKDTLNNELASLRRQQVHFNENFMAEKHTQQQLAKQLTEENNMLREQNELLKKYLPEISAKLDKQNKNISGGGQKMEFFHHMEFDGDDFISTQKKAKRRSMSGC